MIRKNQKGFTIVELIIAVAILAVVTLAVCGFIVVGSRSYTSANTDIMLQQEAQLALNQISDVIIDTTDSISYSVGTSGGMQNVLKDSEYGGEATDKCLVVVNRNDTDSNNHNPSYWFYWSKPDETIYFNEVPAVNSTMTPDEIQAGFAGADTDKAVLAEHVTDLSIDISQFEANRVVMISMTLRNGNREYSTSNNVTVRNKIALNVVDIDPMKRADEFKIDTVSSVTLEPGESYGLTATVDSSSSDKAIKWELAESPQNGTTITADGNLSIGIGETRPNFYVRVSRVNEEYAGQNDRVSRRVQVKVKRVTYVSDDDITAAPGDTIELSNAALRGNNLGEYCFGCTDSLDEDKALDRDSWRAASKAELVSFTDKGDKNATVQISSAAQDGDVIVIQADSLRSGTKRKGYGPETNPTTAPVTGEWRIKIVGNSNIIPLPSNSGFTFGTDNDDRSQMTFTFIADNANMSYYGKYIVCARVREMGVTTSENDQVIVYYGKQGRDVRFAPDLFGLELNRDYQIFLQLLIPVKISNYKDGSAVNASDKEDSGYEVAQEYVSHVDSMGSYNGGVYEASPLFAGLLSPPAISVIADDMEFPNDDDEHISCHLLYDENTNVIYNIKFGDALNIREDFSLNGKVKLPIYKKVGNDKTLVAGYDLSANSNADSNNYIANTFGNGVFSVSTQGSGHPNLSGTPYMTRKYKSNINKNDVEGACGTYYIVPGFWYKNLEPDEIRPGSPYEIYYMDVHNDHAWHYYPQEQSTVTIVVDSGLNLPISTDDSWTFFPLPTDSSFPFARRSSEVQTIDWSRFDIYSKEGAWKNYIENVKIDCTYKPAVGSDREIYIIKIYSEQRTGVSYTRHVYGEYTWRPGEIEWSLKSGAGDEKGEDKTNIEIVRDGVTYLAYFPAPTDSDYPFKSGVTALTGRSLSIYQKNGSDTRNIKVDVTGIGSGKIRLTGVEMQGKHKQANYTYGSYTWDDSSKTWTGPDGTAATTYEVVNGAVYDSRLHYYIEIPLPGTDGFPGVGVNKTVSTNDGYYAYNDKYCEERDYSQWIAYDIFYEYNSGTGVYTVEVRQPYSNGNGNPYDTWTWKEGQLNWR